MTVFKDQPEVSPEEAGVVHSTVEIGNVFRCNRVEKDWLHHPEMPSNYMITLLHHTLFEGVDYFLEKGMTPNKPGDYRIEDIKITGEPDNFCARGLDVKYLMRDYSAVLGQIINNLPALPNKHVPEIIHNAAWAYYAFIRIHPFLDGNGRVSRMILQRILKGAGFKDIIFSQEVGHGKKRYLENRENHLDSLIRVDKTGNLGYLEVYLANLLTTRYFNEDPINLELQEFISRKKQELQSQKQKLGLKDIWDKFKDVDIYGGHEDSYSSPK